MTSSPIFFIWESLQGIPLACCQFTPLLIYTHRCIEALHWERVLPENSTRSITWPTCPRVQCMTNKLSRPKPCMCTILCSQNCANLSSYLSTQRETCSSSLYKFLFSEQSLLTTYSVVGFSFSFSSEKRKKINMGKTVN